MVEDPPAAGTATDVTDDSPYTEGTVVDIFSKANPGWDFVNWTAPAGSFDDANDPDTTFTMPEQAATLTAKYLEGDLSVAYPDEIEDRDDPATIIITVEGAKLNIGEKIIIKDFDSINLWKTAEDIDLSDFSVGTSQIGANINKTLSSEELELEVADADIEAGETITVEINQSNDSDFWIGDSNESKPFTTERTDTGAPKNFSLTINTPEYSLRDIGPAGGHIFYIDTDDDFDWKYLEAASEKAESSNTRWGESGDPGGTSDDIGAGAKNTEIIADSSINSYAVNYARSRNVGGYSDWFLPSYDELREMYDELHLHDKGDFRNSHYWSSTIEGRDNTVRGIFFSNGDGVGIARSHEHPVRPARPF